MPACLIEQQQGMTCGATLPEIPARCRPIAWVVQFGRVKRIGKLSGGRISRQTPAALPSLGQIAPKIQGKAGRGALREGGPAGRGAAAAPGPLIWPIAG